MGVPVWDASGRVAAALDSLLADHGQAALCNKHIMESTLSDLLPDEPREQNVLVQAAQAGIAEVLREKIDQHVGADAAQALAARSLAAHSGLAPDACTWAVSVIADAMQRAASAPGQRQEAPPHDPHEGAAIVDPAADGAVIALRTLAAEHGLAALSDTSLVSGLLKDLLPDAPLETNVLVQAVGAGLPAFLRERLDQQVSPAAAQAQAAQMLAEVTGLAAESCRWAAATFADVLGVTGAAGGGLGSPADDTRLTVPPRADLTQNQPTVPHADVTDDSAGPDSETAPPAPRRFRRRAVVIAASAALVLLISGVALAVTRNSGSQATDWAAGHTLTGRIRDLGSRNNGLGSLQASPRGDALAIADGRTAYWWNTSTDRQIASLDVGPGRETWDAAVDPDRSLLAVAVSDGTTDLWSTASYQVVATLRNGDRGVPITSVAFEPDGAVLATGDLNGVTDLWNISTRKRIATLRDPDSEGVNSVAFSPDGSILATGDDNGVTDLWNISTRKRIATLRDPDSEGVYSVAFSPDGSILATGDDNGATDLWNASTRKRIATLRDPDSEGVNSVAFSPDGSILATGDDNGATDLWNASTRKRIATLRDPDSEGVAAVSFSSSGTTLYIGNLHGVTNIWAAKS